MWFFSLLLSLSLATPDRLSTIQKDLSEAEAIYLSEGLASIVEFPKPITEVRMGNPSVLKAEISQVSPKELTLFLKESGLGPTNLIVRADRRVYVFDILPSRSTHQDYVKISGAFGAPSYSSSKELLQSESIKFKTKLPPVRGVQIESVKFQ